MKKYRLTYISSASIQSFDVQAESLDQAVADYKHYELIKVEEI